MARNTQNQKVMVVTIIRMMFLELNLKVVFVKEDMVVFFLGFLHVSETTSKGD